MKGEFRRYGFLPIVEMRMLREMQRANAPLTIVNAVVLQGSERCAKGIDIGELRKKVKSTVDAINLEIGWDLFR